MTTRTVLLLVLLVLALPPPAQADHDGPLAGQWHADETSTCCAGQPTTYDTTPDSSGHALHLVTGTGGAGGPITLEDGGRFGKGIAAGNTSLISRTQTPLLQPQRLTVVAWVRHSGDPGALGYI